MNDTLNPPRTIMEVFRMLPEGTLAEVIDGLLYMSPAPTPLHQRISMDLSTELNQYVRESRKGKLFAAPIELYLDEETHVVQPDILFVSTANLLQIDPDGLHGVPDLIIEILSPGNRQHDLVTKKALYEQAGVQEYWTIDPETEEAEGWLLKSQSFITIGKFSGKIEGRILGRTFAWLD